MPAYSLFRIQLESHILQPLPLSIRVVQDQEVVTDPSLSPRGRQVSKRFINAHGRNGNIRTLGGRSPGRALLGTTPPFPSIGLQPLGLGGVNWPSPTSSGSSRVFPTAHRTASRYSRPHPTPRNIALAPLGASLRGLRRPRLAKRGIAPPRPTACARSHWTVTGMGGACVRAHRAGRARSPEPRPLVPAWVGILSSQVRGAWRPAQGARRLLWLLR